MKFTKETLKEKKKNGPGVIPYIHAFILIYDKDPIQSFLH